MCHTLKIIDLEELMKHLCTAVSIHHNQGMSETRESLLRLKRKFGHERLMRENWYKLEKVKHAKGGPAPQEKHMHEAYTLDYVMVCIDKELAKFPE